jgi:hypothetical protein
MRRHFTFALTFAVVLLGGAASAQAVIANMGRTGPTSVGRHSSVPHAIAHDPSRYPRRRDRRRSPRRVLARASIVGGPSGSIASTGPNEVSAGLSVKLQLLPESLKELLRHGVSLKVTVNEVADGIASISIGRGQAKRARVAVTIGRGTVKGLVNGTVELRLRLSRKVAAKIGRLRQVTLTIHLTLLDRSGDKQTVDVVGRY